MMKWLRKYNKHMLVGLVAFLMVAFLIQDYLTSRQQDRAHEDWGRLKGTMLRTDALEDARTTAAILERLRIDWRNPWTAQLSWLYQRQLDLSSLSIDDFALLLYEARQADWHVTSRHVEAYLQANGADRLVNTVRQQYGVTRDQVYAAVADYMKMLRQSALVLDSAHVTENELRQSVRDAMETVKVAFVAFPSKRFVDPTLQSSEQEIQAQYEQFRDVEPSEEKGEFGYKWPRRVALEMLSISVADVKPSVTILEDQSRNYYRQHREEFTVLETPSTAPASQAATQPDDPTASTPAATTAPATATAPSVRQKPFREVREEIENTLRERAAESRSREFIDQILSELSSPWMVQKRGEDKYLQRPSGVDAPGYLEEIGRRFSERFGVPIVHHRTGLMSEADLKADKSLKGLHAIIEGEMPLGLSDYAFRVPLFFDATNVSETELRLALYQPSHSPFVQAADDGSPERFVVFRVIDARESESPKSLDEVRDRVIADLRLKHADERAEEMADRLYVAACAMGLKAALEADPELKGMLAATDEDEDEGKDEGHPLKEPAAFPRKSPFTNEPAFVPGVGASARFVNACFEMTASDWQPTLSTRPAITQISAPATQPAPKVSLVHTENARNRYVVELVTHEPVREDLYAARRAAVRDHLISMRRIPMLQAWYTPEQIHRRLQFEPARVERSAEAL